MISGIDRTSTPFFPWTLGQYLTILSGCCCSFQLHLASSCLHSVPSKPDCLAVSCLSYLHSDLYNKSWLFKHLVRALSVVCSLHRVQWRQKKRKWESVSCVWFFCNPMVCPWNSLGKNTGVGCHSLLQGIFLTQGSYWGLLHCRQSLYHLSYQWQQSLYNLLT